MGLSHEQCGRYKDGLCGGMTWSNGDPVHCYYDRNQLPCPVDAALRTRDEKLERVEKLVGRWRRKKSRRQENAFGECSYELEAALSNQLKEATSEAR